MMALFIGITHLADRISFVSLFVCFVATRLCQLGINKLKCVGILFVEYVLHFVKKTTTILIFYFSPTLLFSRRLYFAVADFM